MNSFSKIAVCFAMVIATILLGLATAIFGSAVVALTAVAVGVLLAPVFVCVVAIFILAAIPFAAIQVGGFNTPVFVVLTPVALLALLVLRFRSESQPRFSKESVWALAGASLLLVAGTESFLITNGINGAEDLREYLKWAIAASWVFVPFIATPAARKKLVFAFVVGASLGAAISVASVVGVGASQINSLLGNLGYVRTANGARFFIVGSQQVASRAAGSYGDPNIAGLWFMSAFLLSFALKQLRTAVIWRILLLVGLGFTLSRGAMFGLLVAVLVEVVFGRPDMRRRATVALALICAVSLVYVIPITHERVVTSFSGTDRGVNDRITSLSSFRSAMNSHWLAGHGFGRREFRDSAAAFKTNVVANAPLASVYRGGLVAGLGFVAWYVLAVWLGFSAVRRRLTRESVSFGLATIGLCVAALTGYSLALVPCAVALFSWTVSMTTSLAVPSPDTARPTQSFLTPGRLRQGAPGLATE